MCQLGKYSYMHLIYIVHLYTSSDGMAPNKPNIYIYRLYIYKYISILTDIYIYIIFFKRIKG